MELFFFNNRIQSTRDELWKSDGTEVGTVKLRQFVALAGDSKSKPQGFVSIGNTLYFTANDVNGVELWKSDGTEAGTVEVVDLNPNVVGGFKSYGLVAGGLIVFKDKLYFNGNSSDNDKELYTSDGTAGGTRMVKNIKLGMYNSSDPTNFIVFNNELFFNANGVMWKTDGTEIGTVKVVDKAFDNPHIFKNKLYFNTGDNPSGVWLSDGTTSGTISVSDTAGTITGANSDFIFTNGTTYSYPPPTFIPVIKSSFNKLNGTQGNITKITSDVSEGTSFSLINNKMYSITSNGVLESDGTSVGTKKLPLPAVSFTIYKNKLYFPKSDVATGNELWFYDPALVTGVSSKANNVSVNIFPNPSTGKFIVDHKIENLEVYNMIGEKVLQQSSNEVNLSSSPAGIYSVIINDGANIFTKKIIVQ